MDNSESNPMATIQVDLLTFERLTKLSDELKTTTGEVLRRAITELEQNRFMDQVVADFELLMSDPVALRQYNHALAHWE